LALAGLFGNGPLPDVGVGLGARAQLTRQRFGLRLLGDYWLPRFLGVNDGGGAGPGLDLGAWGVGLMGCYLPQTGSVSMAACAGPLVGDMYGSGNSLLTNPRTSHRRWSAIAAELEVAVRPSHALLGWVGVQLAKTLEAPRFGISENSRPVELFAANSWTVSGLVGVGLSL
jgi:hypothetical protein